MQIDADLIPNGRHCVRVIALADDDPGRFWQVPENYYRDADGQVCFGMEEFDVQ